MFRKKDDVIDDYNVEINFEGVEVFYQFSNLSEMEFNNKLSDVISVSGI